jgi:PAS domain S-box-containing protein
MTSHNPEIHATDMPTDQQRIAELERQLDRLLKENLRLQERMEWLSVFFERAPVGFILESKGGWVIESNTATQQILGYSAEELRGMAFTEFSHPEDLGNELEMFEKLLTGEHRSYTNKKRYIRKDGTVIHGQVHVSFLHEPGGVSQPVVIGIIEPIENPE